MQICISYLKDIDYKYETDQRLSQKNILHGGKVFFRL